MVCNLFLKKRFYVISVGPFHAENEERFSIKGEPPQNSIRLVSGYFLYPILRIWLAKVAMGNLLWVKFDKLFIFSREQNVGDIHFFCAT